MIRSLYEQFGFFPSLFITTFMVVFIIFWLAGIAGILTNPDRKNTVGIFTIALCVIVPPFPAIWLIFDMIRQYRKISAKRVKALKTDSA